MKILHSGTLDINAGGPAMSVYNTLNGLRKIGVDTEIIMYPLSANGKLRGDDIRFITQKHLLIINFFSLLA